MASCPACGKELPGEFPFCPFCATPLAEQPAASVQEERKVVTVLFCDLVGFTAASEHADPEDVRARIRTYHARLREEIERYGGGVEKFIGDAVMAVFGAPVAHEDDAERAVRAGLRILEAIEELNEADPTLSLQVRVGINTGEAVVALGARLEKGEGIVTGDVVNTAARLQSVAPANAIAVSEQTYRATERVFDYEELETVTVKGKSKPLATWRPLTPRARFGADVTRTHATPLVGRDLEKQLVIGTFERAVQQRSCQLVTIMGEPGVGKSRLCSELFQYIEDRPGLIRWRQGRCLPYGEGIAFWALGEVVKAECGILESDSPEQATTKLDLALAPEGSDRVWLRARLLPLVGAGGEPAPQEESFTAWRRFCESLAVEQPAVLVFEDLHWGDEAFLRFLEHLADWSEDVPLLLLCTARPELYERHPTFGANARNAQRINLVPLTDEETAYLISLLLGRPVLSAETQQQLLDRAGGNPFYAEEFVRLLADCGDTGGTVEVPDSVQALIAARLDTLSPERKSMLQDAAVIGKVFWASALAEMGGRKPKEIEIDLHELARKELLRSARTSSMEGELEYGFWHALIRDVCYSQIPRAARAARHRAAAAWIERKAGERVEDLADVLAYHYLQALELVRLVGPAADVGMLEEQTRRYLLLAGERALPLDVTSAEASLARALELSPAVDLERARTLERWAEAAQQQYRLHEAAEALEGALAIYREGGEMLAAGRVLSSLSVVAARTAGGRREEETIAEAIALLEAERPGPELVAAYANLAGHQAVSARFEKAIAAADRALELAAELGLPEPARALGFRGDARSYLGQKEGLEDMRRARSLAVEQSQGRTAAVQHNNLAMATWLYEGPPSALAVCREGIAFCERRGIAEFTLNIGAMIPTFAAECGLPDEALADAGSLSERMEAAGDLSFVEPRSVQLRLLIERGVGVDAAAAHGLVRAARESGGPQEFAMGFTAAARVLHARGREQEAHALVAELERIDGVRTAAYYRALLAELVRTALALDDLNLAARLVEGVEPKTPLEEHALVACRAQLAEARGEVRDAGELYRDAAERWREFGNVPASAYALLGQGRCLAALGNSDAEEPLRQAHDLFASMGYRPALAETESLLAETTAAAS